MLSDHLNVLGRLDILSVTTSSEKEQLVCLNLGFRVGLRYRTGEVSFLEKEESNGEYRCDAGMLEQLLILLIFPLFS